MIELKDIKDFDIKATFLSGQCFRWNEINENKFVGVVKNNIITMEFCNNTLYIDGISDEEFENFYKHYFDLNTNYDIIKSELSVDNVMKEAITFSPNIKILNQEFWETLCSYIISQNNNIARIKTIVDKLCVEFGTRIKDDYYSFPSAQTLSELSLEEINVIKAGFRGKYILDAAKKIRDKTITIDSICDMTLEESREYLMQIKGVGPKVAECTLLYGANKKDAFPIDVWMKRAIEHLYPDGIPEIVTKNAGIAQLYIFNYARLCPDLFKNI